MAKTGDLFKLVHLRTSLYWPPTTGDIWWLATEAHTVNEQEVGILLKCFVTLGGYIPFTQGTWWQCSINTYLFSFHWAATSHLRPNFLDTIPKITPIATPTQYLDVRYCIAPDIVQPRRVHRGGELILWYVSEQVKLYPNSSCSLQHSPFSSRIPPGWSPPTESCSSTSRWWPRVPGYKFQPSRSYSWSLRTTSWRVISLIMAYLHLIETLLIQWT